MELKGLFLIPCYLGENSKTEIFPSYLPLIISEITYFIVENEKSARRFLKFIYPKIDFNKIQLFVFTKKSELQEIQQVLDFLKQDKLVGLISEAGMPCIADPGNKIVEFCHNNNIKVNPLIGPSSILLALVSSGLNGQKFAFHGYLPIDKSELKRKIQELENSSKKEKFAHIFMETPFRNQQLLEQLFATLNPSTKLCIATDITLQEESIKTKTIKQWKSISLNIHKKPTIFIIQY